jgi:hypothetical protein
MRTMLSPSFSASAALVLASLAAGSCSSGPLSSCPSDHCQSLAKEITDHGGGPGACNEPTLTFEQACAAYEQCLHQCGQ